MPAASESKRISDTACLRLQDRIGYCFQNQALIDRALTHPSSTAEEDRDNERMEFLGDSILNLCIGQALYERYPHWNEGELTQVKSAVVSTVSLARAGESLGLRDVGRLGKGLPVHEPLPPSVYANLFEAICAAVYLDGGLEAARAFVLRILGPEIRAIAENGREANHKSSLQQLSQKREGVTPHYRMLSATGPDHGKVFEIVAVIGARKFPAGFGRSKKEAEQAAARRALEVLEAEYALAESNQAVSVSSESGRLRPPQFHAASNGEGGGNG
ncbi:MAG: ribonuclease III [Planctomycetes bacterium]|nr:ribonuclease III [Planctomycetota bacterium]